MVLVSGCLAGQRCRYDGETCSDSKVVNLVRSGKAIAVCPEVLGGLGVPRARAELKGGDGYKVLCGAGSVLDENGRDVTAAFLEGAKKASKIAQELGISAAILRRNSPSCGAGEIYDGSFSGTLVQGDGVFAALLKSSGVKIVVK